MKTKIKKLLNLIKKNNGRGVAAFFRNEKDTLQLEDIIKIKLPHNFEYAFHSFKVKKVKDDFASYIIKGFYYEDDDNDGTIKLKIKLENNSNILDILSGLKWNIHTIIVDKDSIGVIASDPEGRLTATAEKNKIKKIKTKKTTQIVDDVENENDDSHKRSVIAMQLKKRTTKSKSAANDKEKIEEHCPMADINKPQLNLIKIKQIVENKEKEKQSNEVPKTPRKSPVKRVVAKNAQKENPK